MDVIDRVQTIQTCLNYHLYTAFQNGINRMNRLGHKQISFIRSWRLLLQHRKVINQITKTYQLKTHQQETFVVNKSENNDQIVVFTLMLTGLKGNFP